MGFDSGWGWCGTPVSSTLSTVLPSLPLPPPCCLPVQNPVGRILNRFGKDQSLVDELLPNTAQVQDQNQSIHYPFVRYETTTDTPPLPRQIAFELYLAVLGSIVVIGVLIPWVLLLLPLMALLFLWLQQRYVRVSRELKRLDGVTRSPIYAHFAQTLTVGVLFNHMGGRGGGRGSESL